MKKLLVIGAGGHGKVVADTAYLSGEWEDIAFLDNYKIGNIIKCPIIGRTDDAVHFLNKYSYLVVALGNNVLRIKLLRVFSEMGFNIATIIHPSAFISENATIEAGTVIFAKCAVNAGAYIGFGCIINTGATVDHDCMLSEGVHLSPGVHLSGDIRIGKYSWLGTGSIVANQISIGDNVVVGAGTVVIRSIENNLTVVGVPGRVIKKNE